MYTDRRQFVKFGRWVVVEQKEEKEKRWVVGRRAAMKLIEVTQVFHQRAMLAPSLEEFGGWVLLG